LEKLADILGDIHQSQVLRVCLWLFGEYCDEIDLVKNVISVIIETLRPLPLVAEDPTAKETKKEEKGDAEKKAPSAPKFTTRTVVLADGTYGTENVYEKGADDVNEKASEKNIKKTQLKSLILGGDLLLPLCSECR
jgi:coatomer subunit beta